MNVRVDGVLINLVGSVRTHVRTTITFQRRAEPTCSTCNRRQAACSARTRCLDMQILCIGRQLEAEILQGLSGVQSPRFAISQANRPSPAPGTSTLKFRLGNRVSNVSEHLDMTGESPTSLLQECQKNAPREPPSSVRSRGHALICPGRKAGIRHRETYYWCR